MTDETTPNEPKQRRKGGLFRLSPHRRPGRLLSFEIVEVNPVVDEHNRTADLAVELACSAFGKKIL